MGPPMSLDPRVRDPYAVFRSSTTPAGLYARQKWLGESSTPQWKEDFAAAVAELVRGQSGTGCGGGSAIETIQRLFGLHLTVRHPDPCIEKGLDALLDIASAAPSETQPDFIQAERCTACLSPRDRVQRSLSRPRCFYVQSLADPPLLESWRCMTHRPGCGSRNRPPGKNFLAAQSPARLGG
jgi:hypothetical protein